MVLSGLNLSVRRGELMVVTGAVGEGKSTLLAALAAARPLLAGERLATRGERRAYASQKPFLLNDTIRGYLGSCPHARVHGLLDCTSTLKSCFVSLNRRLCGTNLGGNIVFGLEYSERRYRATPCPWPALL